jgi:hypothetical protein
MLLEKEEIIREDVICSDATVSKITAGKVIYSISFDSTFPSFSCMILSFLIRYPAAIINKEIIKAVFVSDTTLNKLRGKSKGFVE